MKQALREKLWALAAPANPTEEKMAPIIAGWDELFAYIGVSEDEAEAEFDAIMRARLQVGVVSLVPDRVFWPHVEPVRVGGAYMPPRAFGEPWRRTKKQERCDVDDGSVELPEAVQPPSATKRTNVTNEIQAKGAR